MVTPMKLQRVRKELSQDMLAKRVGIPQCKISFIERGLVPHQEEAERIAQALDVPVDEIFPSLAQEVRG